MSDCPALESFTSVKDSDVKATMRGWIDDYKVCKLKHDILVECIQKQ